VTVHHVFPYDPGHLGLTLEQWWPGQLLRWPLAAVARSRSAADTVVHVIADRSARLPDHEAPLRLQVHRTLYRNPRWHAWGDDWSVGLGRALRRAGHDDIVVVHLEGYAAARLSLRAAHGARCVLVLHGRGTGSVQEHDAADVSVVLNDDARNTLRSRGVPDARLLAMTPSVDRETFHPRLEPPRAETVLGYVGRLEESKGAFELPGIVRSLADLGVRLECVGTTPRPADARRAAVAFDGIPVELCGELPPAEVAARMRSWAALVLPSYTEGMPLVALEALSSGIPVVAVEGVLPETLASRQGVWVGSRATLADRTRAALASPHVPDSGWIPDHREGGATWDAIYEALPRWRPRFIPSARPFVGRFKRLTPT
jgi:glycosyltransferase involved in cell wall biosynthesis